MTAHNDVMRSDRLKQVMQEIDPTFNEKDVGFSRFSKFVVEAAHKGLINLTKLDNGQYEIALGPGVPGAAAQPAISGAPAPREREDRARGPRRRHEESRSRRPGGFSLGDAFGLLKQALSRLGGSDKAVSADELRDTMIELNGADAEPLDVERFPKLLRQAHDAEIIDLSKQDDGVYAVKLREETPPPASLAPAASAHAGVLCAAPTATRDPHAVTRGRAVAQCPLSPWLPGAPGRAARDPKDRRRRGGSELQAAHRADPGSPARQPARRHGGTGQASHRGESAGAGGGRSWPRRARSSRRGRGWGWSARRRRNPGRPRARGARWSRPQRWSRPEWTRTLGWG